MFFASFFFSVFFVFENFGVFYIEWCDFMSHGGFFFFFSKGVFFFFESCFQKKSKISICLFPKVFQFQRFFFSSGLCFSSCDGFLFKCFSPKLRVLIFPKLVFISKRLLSQKNGGFFLKVFLNGLFFEKFYPYFNSSFVFIRAVSLKRGVHFKK